MYKIAHSISQIFYRTDHRRLCPRPYMEEMETNGNGNGNGVGGRNG